MKREGNGQCTPNGFTSTWVQIWVWRRLERNGGKKRKKQGDKSMRRNTQRKTKESEKVTNTNVRKRTRAVEAVFAFVA